MEIYYYVTYDLEAFIFHVVLYFIYRMCFLLLRYITNFAARALLIYYNRLLYTRCYIIDRLLIL